MFIRCLCVQPSSLCFFHQTSANLPLASGSWEGQLEGQDTSRAVTGFGDPRVALSLNFVGAPALRARDFGSYRQTTIVGAILRVTVPLGQYDPSKLINLGSNRWTFRLQVGASHAMGPWILEAYAAGWFFTTNPNFFGGSKLEQHPLATFKLHFIRSLGRRFWIALDGGPLVAQTGVTNGQWPHYGGDQGATRYSSLDQIDATNAGYRALVFDPVVCFLISISLMQ